MGNAFEDAMHNGYSVADLEADQKEAEQRAKELGCYDCGYSSIYHPTCNAMREGTLAKCPYFKKAGAV